jgi:hypothetical protein
MTISRLCSACTKAVVSDEGAATFHGALVHGACYPAVKARHDAEVRAAKEAASAAKPSDLYGLLRRFFLWSSSR